LVKFHIPLKWSECFHESICKALDFFVSCHTVPSVTPNI